MTEFRVWRTAKDEEGVQGLMRAVIPTADPERYPELACCWGDKQSRKAHDGSVIPWVMKEGAAPSRLAGLDLDVPDSSLDVGYEDRDVSGVLAAGSGDGQMLKVGAKVEAHWRTSQWYKAKIVAANANGTYEYVTLHGGDSPAHGAARAAAGATAKRMQAQTSLSGFPYRVFRVLYDDGEPEAQVSTARVRGYAGSGVTRTRARRPGSPCLICSLSRWCLHAQTASTRHTRS